MFSMKRIAWRLIALLASVPLLAAWWPFGKLDWPTIITRVRTEFPQVRQMSTTELAAIAPASVLLIDTRTAEEFGVSHLRGAARAETLEAVRALVTTAKPDQRVVLYCSVGYRSAKLADALQRAGQSNVWNLEGSIFAWVNEGRAVVRNGAEVREVHPYNNRWGALLEKKFWPAGGWRAV